MNIIRLLVVAIAVSSLGIQALVAADDTASVLSAQELVDLLLSPNRDDHSRGVDYVVDNKPDLTTQIPRLIAGLASAERLVRSACGTGLWHGNWDEKTMEKHASELLKLLAEGNREAQLAARRTLEQIAPSLEDRMPELVGLAKKKPLAAEPILAISKEIGLSKRQWISSWLPLAVDDKRYRNAICSMDRSSEILLKLMDAGQPECVVPAVLEMLASKSQTSKAAEEFAARMLGHRSSQIRLAAISALAQIPHDREVARPKLISIAKTDGEELRAAAVRRLFHDPGLRKNPDERSAGEKQAVKIVYDAFSDDSPVVRRAACSGGGSTALDRRLAEKLIERLEDSNSDVRVAAHSALGSMVGSAMRVVNFDSAKVERYYRELIKEQSDTPKQAQKVFNQTMTDVRKAVTAARLLLQFIEEIAQKHKEVAVRDRLRQFLTDDVYEHSRQAVPESMRIEKGIR